MSADFEGSGVQVSQLLQMLEHDLAAERFAIWLALAPILHDMAELNRDNDDGDVTGYEVRLFLQRIHARLEAIGQGLHRFDGEGS